MNARFLHGVSPTWDNFMAHSTYDGYWEAGSTLPDLTDVAVPTLNVVGWWDAANLGGALDIYDRLEPLDKKNLNRIVVGPCRPDEVNEFAINLRTRNHRFRKGHRIIVQVQCSWFPLIYRNPQAFTNIMTAVESDYQSARQRVYCTEQHPSYIELSIRK